MQWPSSDVFYLVMDAESESQLSFQGDHFFIWLYVNDFCS
jgi:hypothetical protein